MIIKSKLLRKMLAEQKKKDDIAMKKWFESILPRKGSVLRQLVDIELNKK